MFVRRRVPWWSKPFMLIAVLVGLFYSEKYAPILTKHMTLGWWINTARKSPQYIKKIEKLVKDLTG